MIKRIILTIALLCIAACASVDYPPTASEMVLFQNARAPMAFHDVGIIWRHAGSHKTNGIKITTFVPTDETERTAVRKIVMTHYRNKPRYPINAYEYYINTVVADFNTQCYTSTSDIHLLEKASHEVLYSYQMYNCGKRANQYVVGRVVQSRRSISSIAYIVKTDKLPAEAQRKAMLQLVAHARVIKD